MAICTERRGNQRVAWGGTSVGRSLKVAALRPRYRIAYQGFLRELRDANPGDRLTIDAANGHVSAGVLYKALKEIRKLVRREDELLAA